MGTLGQQSLLHASNNTFAKTVVKERGFCRRVAVYLQGAAEAEDTCGGFREQRLEN